MLLLGGKLGLIIPDRKWNCFFVRIFYVFHFLFDTALVVIRGIAPRVCILLIATCTTLNVSTANTRST